MSPGSLDLINQTVPHWYLIEAEWVFLFFSNTVLTGAWGEEGVWANKIPLKVLQAQVISSQPMSGTGKYLGEWTPVLNRFICLFIYFYFLLMVAHRYHSTCMEVRTTCWSQFLHPPCGPRRSNLGHMVWQQNTLPTEPFYSPRSKYLKGDSLFNRKTVWFWYTIEGADVYAYVCLSRANPDLHWLSGRSLWDLCHGFSPVQVFASQEFQACQSKSSGEPLKEPNVVALGLQYQWAPLFLQEARTKLQRHGNGHWPLKMRRQSVL